MKTLREFLNEDLNVDLNLLIHDSIRINEENYDEMFKKSNAFKDKIELKYFTDKDIEQMKYYDNPEKFLKDPKTFQLLKKVQNDVMANISKGSAKYDNTYNVASAKKALASEFINLWKRKIQLSNKTGKV